MWNTHSDKTINVNIFKLNIFVTRHLYGVFPKSGVSSIHVRLYHVILRYLLFENAFLPCMFVFICIPTVDAHKTSLLSYFRCSLFIIEHGYVWTNRLTYLRSSAQPWHCVCLLPTATKDILDNWLWTRIIFTIWKEPDVFIFYCAYLIFYSKLDDIFTRIELCRYWFHKINIAI